MLKEITSAADETFIRVTEVWTIDPVDNRLKLASGLYGTLDAFAAVSGTESFAHGEGLPGKAWAEARPVVLQGFRGSYFKRTDAAEAAGLTSAVALPVFAGQTLRGVVVFLFGGDATHVGAVEAWHAPDGVGTTMALDDGYYGAADHFAWISRHTRFPKGSGLPGSVWRAGAAVLFRDLGKSHRFLRSDSAAEAGITAGLGLPVPTPAPGTFVMTLLSALGTPIARRFEVWDRMDSGEFVFIEGVTDSGEDLAPETMPERFRSGSGLLGQVAATGVPVALTEGSAARVAVPIHRGETVAQVVAWTF